MNAKTPDQEQHKNGVRQKYSEALIRYTIEVWQPRSEKTLTREDAILILDRMISAFRPIVIAKGKQRRRSREARKKRNVEDEEASIFVGNM